MNEQKYTIKYQIDLFRSELKNLYPGYEIESITYLVLGNILKLNMRSLHLVLLHILWVISLPIKVTGILMPE